MPSVKLTLPSGTEITVSGSQEEITSIVSALEGKKTQHIRSKKETDSTAKGRKISSSPTDLILSLIDGDFFTKPKDLAAIKARLEELGHIYPVTTLSAIVFKMTRKRYLRRFKEEGRRVYTSK